VGKLENSQRVTYKIKLDTHKMRCDTCHHCDEDQSHLYLLDEVGRNHEYLEGDIQPLASTHSNNYWFPQK
jgi:hypothetical protein